MSASYGFVNYFGLFFAFSACALCVFTIFIIVGARWKKQGRSQAQRNELLRGLFVVGAVILLISVMVFVPSVAGAGDLLLPGMYEVRKTAGTVEHIMPEDHVSVFYADGELHSGATYYIDGHYYYGIDDGRLQRGMLVELEYAHSAHDGVILRWREVTPEQAAQTLAEAKQQAAQRKVPEEPTKPVQPVRRAPIVISKQLDTVLTWIQYICNAGFIGMVALQQRFSTVKRPYCWNMRQDGRITFNWVIGGFRMVQFGCIHIWLLCACIRGLKYGFNGISILFVALILFHLAYFLYDLTRRMEIDGELVTVSCFGRQHQYAASEIRSVKWEMTRKGRKYFEVGVFPFDDWERVMDT